jgi:hypothetical protein
VTEPLRLLASRIRHEMVELERILARMTEGWQRARRTNDEYYLDGVALNLHGFYSGLERIFEQIAGMIDGSVPQGENWHQLLLQQMVQEEPGIRPAVISDEVCQQLSEYRGFRHVVRNVYTSHFDPVRIEKLVLAAPDVFESVKAELLAFARFLEQGDA